MGSGGVKGGVGVYILQISEILKVGVGVIELLKKCLKMKINNVFCDDMSE